MNKDDRKRYLILKDPNIYKGLLILAIPLMLNNLLRTIHDVVDMYFVGKDPTYSAEAIGSISVTFPVLFTFLSLGFGFGIAGTALISQLVGSAQFDDAKKYASNLLILALIVGVTLNIISFFGAPYIMDLMGTEGFVYTNAVKYLQIRSFELPVLFMFFAFTAIRQSTGDTMTPVIYGVIAIVVNIVLDPIFILDDITMFGITINGLGLGVAGAAYATLIANIVIMPFAIYTLFNSKDGIRLKIREMKAQVAIMIHITKTAIPASLGQSLTAIGFVFMTSIIVSYGNDTVAAFSVGNRLSSLILHPVMAIGGVVATYIGQNIGNLNVERAKDSFKKAMLMSVGLMTIGSLIFLNFREYFAGFFIVDNPEALALTVEYMFYLLIGLPLMGIFQTFVGTYNGTGNTMYTFIISITRLWLLRIPMIIIFRNFTDLGSSGIWYGMLISNFVIAFVGFILYQFVDFAPKISLKDKPKIEPSTI